MTHASLFSGIGGFDLAADRMGWQNVFNCEIDPFCRKVLAYHFPNAKQYEDVKTTDFTIYRGHIDVLTGKRLQRQTNYRKRNNTIMRHIEDSLQKNCVRWFSLQFREYAQLLHHSPNGGKRNAIEAAKFKAMGVRAGFPDLILCIARHGYHGLFVELKTAKGRQSENQKYYQCVLEEQDYRYEVVRSIEDFIQIINEYMSDDVD